MKNWRYSLILFLGFMSTSLLAETHQLTQSQLIDWPYSRQSPIIIDVRPKSEFDKGHIPLAINIPHSDILANPGIMSDYKNKDIVVYCWSGSKAKRVLSELDNLGYPALYHLNGDMQDWLSQGREVAF